MANYIYYNTNYGSKTRKTITVPYSLTSTDLTNPATTEYNFLYWCYDEARTNRARVGNRLTSTTTLYAKFQDDTINVTSTLPTTITVGDTFTLSGTFTTHISSYLSIRLLGTGVSFMDTIPTRSGSTWTTDVTITDITSITPIITIQIGRYTHGYWMETLATTQVSLTALTYNIAYSTPHGSKATKAVLPNYQLTAEDLTAPENNYNFINWCFDSELTDVAEVGDAIISNTTLYANYVTTSSFTFDDVEDNVAYADTEFIITGTYSSIYKNPLLFLDSWPSDVDVEDGDLDPVTGTWYQTVIIPSNNRVNATFKFGLWSTYARAKEISVEHTFRINRSRLYKISEFGTVDGPIQYIYSPFTISSATLSAPTDYPPSYEFEGWYWDSTYETRVAVGDTVPLGKCYMYAKWNKSLNKINIKNDTYFDNKIISGDIALENSMVAETLSADTATVVVLSDTDITNTYKYGDVMTIQHESGTIGRFYVENIVRVSINQYKITACSAVGLLINQTNYGGIWINGITVKELIRTLLNGIYLQTDSYGEHYTGVVNYCITTDVGNTMVYGALPIATSRDNLQQVLFAIGASCLKLSSGELYFRYLKIGTAQPVQGQVYMGGDINYLTPASKVYVTEHSYYSLSSDLEVTLFDNTDGSGIADNKLVTFNNPCHNLTPSGTLTINSSGANYAFVSGTGTLTGKEYTHTKKIIEVENVGNVEENEISVEDATLVSQNNSYNVAQRVANYYGVAQEVGYSFIETDEKCGDYISYVNPFNETETGIIKKMTLTLSGKIKANCTIASNFVPGNFGNNYDNSIIKTGSGTITKAELEAIAGKPVNRIHLVVGAGGNGGNGGQAGFIAPYCTWDSWGEYYYFVTPENYCEGGNGGNSGIGGKVFVTDITMPTSLTYNCGNGGNGGSAGITSGATGTTGTSGTHTTITDGTNTYDSDNGEIPVNGIIDIITGNVYSTTGTNGYKGGNGGHFPEYDLSQQWSESIKTKPFPVSSAGQDVLTYTGGTIGTFVDNGRSAYDDYSYATAGNGGGAAYGVNGGNGGTGTITYKSTYSGHMYNVTAAAGGQGATPIAIPTAIPYGGGGHGGSGGGGAGMGGLGNGANIKSEDYRNFSTGTNTNFGSGCNGSNGGNGYILIQF